MSLSVSSVATTSTTFLASVNCDQIPTINNNIEAFTQSDWEFELDLMINPTRAQLVAHMAKLPISETNSPIAVLVRSHINAMEE